MAVVQRDEYILRGDGALFQHLPIVSVPLDCLSCEHFCIRQAVGRVGYVYRMSQYLRINEYHGTSSSYIRFKYIYMNLNAYIYTYILIYHTLLALVLDLSCWIISGVVSQGQSNVQGSRIWGNSGGLGTQ